MHSYTLSVICICLCLRVRKEINDKRMIVLILLAVVLSHLTLSASALSSNDAHVVMRAYVSPIDGVWSDMLDLIISNSNNEVLMQIDCWLPDAAIRQSFTWPCGTQMELLSFVKNLTPICSSTGPIVEVQGVLSGVSSEYVFKYGKALDWREAPSPVNVWCTADGFDSRFCTDVVGASSSSSSSVSSSASTQHSSTALPLSSTASSVSSTASPLSPVEQCIAQGDKNATCSDYFDHTTDVVCATGDTKLTCWFKAAPSLTNFTCTFNRGANVSMNGTSTFDQWCTSDISIGNFKGLLFGFPTMEMCPHLCVNRHVPMFGTLQPNMDAFTAALVDTTCIENMFGAYCESCLPGWGDADSQCMTSAIWPSEDLLCQVLESQTAQATAPDALFCLTASNDLLACPFAFDDISGPRDGCYIDTSDQMYKCASFKSLCIGTANIEMPDNIVDFAVSMNLETGSFQTLDGFRMHGSDFQCSSAFDGPMCNSQKISDADTSITLAERALSDNRNVSRLVQRIRMFNVYSSLFILYFLRCNPG